MYRSDAIMLTKARYCINQCTLVTLDYVDSSELREVPRAPVGAQSAVVLLRPWRRCLPSCSGLEWRGRAPLVAHFRMLLGSSRVARVVVGFQNDVTAAG